MISKNKNKKKEKGIKFLLAIMSIIYLALFLPLSYAESQKYLDISILVIGVNPIDFNQTEIEDMLINYYTFLNYSVDNTSIKEEAEYLINEWKELGYYDGFEDYDVSFFNADIKEIEVFKEEKNNSIDSFGDFTAKLYYKDGNFIEQKFQPSFIILTDPPTFSEYSSVYLFFPYKENVDRLEVYYLEKLKLNYSLNEYFCNFNNICENKYYGNNDKREDYLSCPSDCKINETDGICTTNEGYEFYWEDNLCDLDCYEDEDCYSKEYYFDYYTEEDNEPFSINLFLEKIKLYLNQELDLSIIKKEIVKWLE